MFKPTRKVLLSELTATITPQEVVFGDLPFKTIINVIDTGIIRLQINDVPVTFDSTHGIIVANTKMLELDQHYIDKIKYIRDSTMSGDIKFQIIGLY